MRKKNIDLVMAHICKKHSWENDQKCRCWLGIVNNKTLELIKNTPSYVPSYFQTLWKRKWCHIFHLVSCILSQNIDKLACLLCQLFLKGSTIIDFPNVFHDTRHTDTNQNRLFHELQDDDPSLLSISKVAHLVVNRKDLLSVNSYGWRTRLWFSFRILSYLFWRTNLDELRVWME